MQDTIKDKSDKLDKFEENKQAIEKEYQQVLEELKQYKVCIIAISSVHMYVKIDFYD